MHFVGLDLAWGLRNPTGVAVLDTDARLLHVDLVHTDDEIVAALGPFTDGDCVVAIDAPLVVTNESGRRPAEAALSADFARFDAGAHPTNLGKPEFAEGPRGGHLARRLGLDLDPRSRRRRRALEVYPHAASIALFGLDKILRYKHKPGRDLELLRSELLALMSRIEGLVQVDDTWARLRSEVEGATQKARLKVVEDQVDAVLCAYVALFAETRPGDVVIYGDRDTGAIVTPRLGFDPEGPAPEVVGDAVRAYARARPALVRAGEEAVSLVAGVLDEAGINYLTVTGRTKTVASFAEKAGRRQAGLRLYDDPMRDITDQVGVRVITYVADDVHAVAQLLGEQVVVTDDRDLGRETASEGRFGYASRHLLIALDAAREGHEDFTHLVGRVVQVQVRTVLQHAWAEFEHDIRYKGSVPAEHAREFDRRFTLAAGLLELADREFTEIRERLRGAAAPSPSSHPDDDPRLDPRELGAFLAGQFPDAGWSRADHYGWMSGLLLELGITSFGELAEVVLAADDVAIAERMAYRQPPGAVRRLDDVLLWVFGERYVGLRENAHRREGLDARLQRLRA